MGGWNKMTGQKKNKLKIENVFKSILLATSPTINFFYGAPIFLLKDKFFVTSHFDMLLQRK